MRVIEECPEQNGCPSAASGVGDVTPAQLWGPASPALCSQLWPVGGTSPSLCRVRGLPKPTNQRRCLEIQHHQQKAFRCFGYIWLRSVKVVLGQV